MSRFVTLTNHLSIWFAFLKLELFEFFNSNQTDKKIKSKFVDILPNTKRDASLDLFTSYFCRF